MILFVGQYLSLEKIVRLSAAPEQSSLKYIYDIFLVNLPSPHLEVFSLAKTILLRRGGTRRSTDLKPLTAFLLTVPKKNDDNRVDSQPRRPADWNTYLNGSVPK